MLSALWINSLDSKGIKCSNFQQENMLLEMIA